MILIAATLLILAAVCGVLFWGLSQSKDIADKGYTAINETVNASDIVTTLQKTDRIPVAACYTLLKENPESIVRLECLLCGRVTTGTDTGDCLKAHIRGKARLILTEEESGGTYTAVLSTG